MPYFYGIKIPINIPRINYLPIEYVDADKLHVTVLYIGKSKVSRRVLDELDSKLRVFPCFKIIISNEVEILPNIVKPKIVALKILDKSRRLRMIREIIINTLKKWSIGIEDKYLHNFNPHLSIGKFRHKVDYNVCREIIDSLERNLCEKEFQVSYVQLIDSTEAKYLVLHVHKLSCLEDEV